MPRVFIVQESLARDGSRTVDLSPAIEFGELVFLMPGDTLPQDWQPIVERMWKLLADFNDDDYIIPVGQGSGGDIAKGVAVAIAASINGGRVKFLRWHSKARKYYPVSIVLWQSAAERVSDELMENWKAPTT